MEDSKRLSKQNHMRKPNEIDLEIAIKGVITSSKTCCKDNIITTCGIGNKFAFDVL